jgi:hypothetical protein
MVVVVVAAALVGAAGTIVTAGVGLAVAAGATVVALVGCSPVLVAGSVANGAVAVAPITGVTGPAFERAQLFSKNAPINNPILANAVGLARNIQTPYCSDAPVLFRLLR